MNNLKVQLLSFLLIAFFIQSCSQEEFNNLEKPIESNLVVIDENIRQSTLNPSLPATSRCDENTIKVQVEYANPNATENEKQKIRDDYNQIVPIKSVRKSPNCSEYEIWEVDCPMYWTCQSGCETTSTEAEIKMPETVVIVNCFGGRL